MSSLPEVRVLNGAAAARSGWADIVAYRDLFRFLIIRDLKIRYSQSILGLGWALLPPITMAIVFSLVFGRMARVPSDGLPYPLFSFSGLIVWTYFSATLGQSTGSVTAGSSMLTKVFFPRIFLPLAPVVGNLVDLTISFGLLLIFFFVAGFSPSPSWLLLPLPILLLIMATSGTGAALASVSVQYRDVKYGVPLVIQLGMFLTPVAYPMSLVPAGLAPWYALNPLVGVLEGFRAALFGLPFPWELWLLGMTSATFLCLLGFTLFRSLEATFADVA